MRVFVIWDHASPAVRTLLEALPELCPTHDEQPITWHIPSATALGQKVARDVVERGIRESEHVIALLDRPSAGVGWQVGLAIGYQRSLQLAFLGAELPTWTQLGVLKGLFAHHLSDVSGVRQLLVPQLWEMPAIPASPAAAGRHLILGPTGPIGSTLREVARQDPAAYVLPEDGWGLYELPALLSGCRRVVFILASDVREGADNAASGVVAGFAHACGLPVSVLRSDDIAPVAEVQQRELRFRGLAEFKQKLQLVASGGASGSGSALPVTAAARAMVSETHRVAAAVEPIRTRQGRAGRGLIAALIGLAVVSGCVAWVLFLRTPGPAVAPQPDGMFQAAPAMLAPRADLGSSVSAAAAAHRPTAPPRASATHRHSRRQPDDLLHLFTQLTRIPGELLPDPRNVDPPPWEIEPSAPSEQPPGRLPRPTPPSDPTPDPQPKRPAEAARPRGQAMSSSDFSALLKRVARETFSETRLGFVEDAVSDGKWFTCEQIAQMMRVPTFSDLKVQMGVTMYAHVVDPENSFLLTAALSHESDRQKLRQLIRP